MIYGLYLSAQGAQAQSTRQEVIANNLANASTTAFKRDLALFQSHRPYAAGGTAEAALPGSLAQSTGGVSLAGVATVFKNGPLLQTGGVLDLALDGPGFFRVSDGRQELLTRNGQFTRNAHGELVTQDSGHRVLGTSGAPIAIPDGASQIEVAGDGTVFQIGPGSTRAELGRIDIVAPDESSQLQKIGSSFYRFQGGIHPAGDAGQIKQGFLEGSGVNPVREMMGLIEASRSFEANVNMMRSQDESLGQLLQTLGRR